jgi:hypothetical protein
MGEIISRIARHRLFRLGDGEPWWLSGWVRRAWRQKASCPRNYSDAQTSQFALPVAGGTSVRAIRICAIAIADIRLSAAVSNLARAVAGFVEGVVHFSDEFLRSAALSGACAYANR